MIITNGGGGGVRDGSPHDELQRRSHGDPRSVRLPADGSSMAEGNKAEEQCAPEEGSIAMAVSMQVRCLGTPVHCCMVGPC